MPGEGVEPTRITSADFKSAASAYSAILARQNIILRKSNEERFISLRQLKQKELQKKKYNN